MIASSVDQDSDRDTGKGSAGGSSTHCSTQNGLQGQSMPVPVQCRQSSASEKALFHLYDLVQKGKRGKTLNSPQSVSIYKNVLEPLLIPESPDLPYLPDPPAPIQKPVVQVEVIHLVHENKPAGGEKVTEEEAGS